MKTIFCAIVVLSFGSCLGAEPIHVKGVGQFSINAGNSRAEQLSGLTYVGPVAGKVNTFLYYTVSDSSPRLYGLEVEFDIHTAAVKSAEIVSKLTLSEGSDLEGIAYSPLDNTVYVSDEDGPAIRRYDPESGNVLKTIPVPAVFSKIRPNQSFESLTLQEKHESLWTANEDTLSVDGDASKAGTGGLVRLLKYNSKLEPAGLWAYETDITGSDPPADKYEGSGVTDMVALPDGRLIVMERMLDVKEILGFRAPMFRTRLYEADVSGATDVSQHADGLIGKTFTPVKKRLLWESTFLGVNYEGMSLGPKLSNGDRSLLLISDDQAGMFYQSLYALRVR